MKVHFMGIGGSGASAAAAIASFHGYTVTGCDIDQQSPYLAQLGGIAIKSGHSPEHLHKQDELILSPAIESLDVSNPEVIEARKLGLKIRTWQEFTGQELMKDKKVIAVTGTHGKTTTTTMIALILEKAGLDPSAIIGAPVREWGANFRVGEGNIFVIEADEYGDNFLNYASDIAVITNIEMDHPEYYRDIAHLQESFTQFVKNMKKGSTLFTTNEVKLINHNGETIQITPLHFDLQLLGTFNQVNASFAYLVCRSLGVEEDLILEVLRNFPGAGRRLELIADKNGTKVYDDYGHHPTEITVTTAALREKYPHSEIWLVYQPHMFTRTKYLFNDFADSLRNAPVDQVILTEIWQSREKNDYSVNSQQLVEAIAKSSVRKIVKYADIASYITSRKKADSIVLFMGAGDIYQASKQFVKVLEEQDG